MSLMGPYHQYARQGMSSCSQTSATLRVPGDAPAPRWFHVAVAFSMVLSAAASLVAALRTSAAMTSLVEQNARLVRASSTPILQLAGTDLSSHGEPEQSLHLQNVGTGPARIVWFAVALDGKALPGPVGLVRLAAAQAPQGWHTAESPGVVTSSLGATVLVAVKDVAAYSLQMPTAADPSGRQVWTELGKLPHKLDVQACYCSVFDECWTTDFSRGLPQAVSQCGAPPHTGGQW
jgi:hypothetical protein